MTLRIFESTWREMPCIRGVAKLSYKRGDKTKHCQKTWIARGEVFAVKREEVEPSFRAADAKWEIETLERIKNGQPPEMSEQEFDEIMERTNQACISKHGKTFCELIEEGEAESAQHNDQAEL